MLWRIFVLKEMAREYDHIFGLVIIGQSDVGKGEILQRFSDSLFSAPDTLMKTIGKYQSNYIAYIKD